MGMSMDEFERQRADSTKRFYIDRDDDEERWAVIDRSTGEVIGCDGGEPEDQVLVRDWRWVVDALNAVADEPPVCPSCKREMP